MNTPGLNRFSRVISTKRAGTCFFCAMPTSAGVDFAAVNGNGAWIAACRNCATSITEQVKGMTRRLGDAAKAVDSAEVEATLRGMLPTSDAHAAAMTGTADENAAFDVLIKLLAAITYLGDATKPVADTDLVAALRAVADNGKATPRDRSFAADLVNHLNRKGALTPGQAPWADKLIAKYAGGASAPQAAAQAAQPVENGLYITVATGAIHKLYNTQNDRQACKVLTVQHLPNGKHAGSFDYLKGGTRVVATMVAKGEARRLTQDEAAAFGRQYSFCCNCARDLNDDRSIAAGYGPVCADHFGWWYPTIAEAAAILNRPAPVENNTMTMRQYTAQLRADND